MTQRFVLTTGLAMALSGCMPSVVESTLIPTDDLSARYEVTTQSDGTARVKAAFRWASGEADVFLDDGDSVVVDGVVLTAGAFPDYETEVSVMDDHAFVLDRGDQQIAQHVAVAPTFAVTSEPLAGTYDLEATLTWSPTLPGATIRIDALPTTSGCGEFTLADDVEDTGSFAFTGADVKSSSTMPPACVFTLEITRTSFDPGTPSPLRSVSLLSRHVASTTLSLF